MPFVGEWLNFEDEIDPLTRTREVTIALFSRDGGVAPVLSIRCEQGELEFLIAWGFPGAMDPISESFWATVQHRIDDEPIETLEWDMSTNEVGTYLPNARIASTIRKLYNAEEFVVQVTPARSGPITAVFEPTGIYWAVKPVLEACEQEIN